MLYLAIIIYVLSFLITYTNMMNLYKRMRWDVSDFRRRPEYRGNRVRDRGYILFVSLIPLMNTINAIELLSRQDEFRKMIEEAEEYRKQLKEDK